MKLEDLELLYSEFNFREIDEDIYDGVGFRRFDFEIPNSPLQIMIEINTGEVEPVAIECYLPHGGNVWPDPNELKVILQVIKEYCIDYPFAHECPPKYQIARDRELTFDKVFG